MGKIKETIKTFASSWIKKFGSIILGVLAGVLGLFVTNRVNESIKNKDKAKKDELKNNIDETKENVKDVSKDLKEVQDKAEEIKETIKEEQEKSDKVVNDYITQQQQLAEEAGFVKNHNIR